MAVLSKHVHFPGITARLVGFDTSALIMDSKSYDSDFNLLSENLIDIPGTPQELVVPGCATWVDYGSETSARISYGGGAFYVPHQDVTADKSIFGFGSVTDPFDSEYTYTLTSVEPLYANISASDNKLRHAIVSRLNKKGEVVASANYGYPSNYVGGYGVAASILDITEDSILIGYNGYLSTYAQGFKSGYSSNPTYTWLDKFTLEPLTKIAPAETPAKTFKTAVASSEFVRQVVGRTTDMIWIYSPQNRKIFYIDKNDKANWFKETPIAVSSPSTPAPASNGSYTRYISYYNAKPHTSLTQAINGWHYEVAWKEGITSESKTIQFTACKLDTDTNTMEHMSATDIRVTVGPKCANGAKLAYSDGASAPSKDGQGNYDVLLNFKVNETDFIVLHCVTCTETYANTIASVLRPNYKTRYYYVHVDPSDPANLTIENEQQLPYGYDGIPILINNDKFGLVRPKSGIDVYRVNKDTKTLDKYWEISTPDLQQAVWYNGCIWWVNKSTNELHYEIEDSTKTIVAKLDKSVYQLSNESDHQDATYSIEVVDGTNKRLASRVELVCGGPAEFPDGTKTKTITTSASALHYETIKITGSGKPRVTAKILS